MPDQAAVERAYVDGFFHRQLLLWEGYSEGVAHDLGGVDAILYDASRSLSTVESDLSRRIGLRGRVDYHQAVGALRNRLERRSASKPEPPGSGGLTATEADVLELIGRRNELARQLGFDSYGHLALWSERLDFDRVVRYVTDVRDSVLVEASDLAAEESLTLGTWFEGLDRIAGPADDDVVAACKELAAVLGFQELASKLTWVIKDQPIFGVAGVISVPDDVRILLRPRGSQAGMATGFHELGHALAHAANRGSGIEATWDVVTDESMASIIESAGVRCLFDRSARDRQRRIETLETARMATSFLFEVAVNADMSDPRRLYLDHYEPLVPIGNAGAWANDTFRSVDPFHIHSYLIGGEVAATTLDHLATSRGDDLAGWGEWLNNKLFVDGRHRTIIEKLTDAGLELSDDLLAISPGCPQRPTEL